MTGLTELIMSFAILVAVFGALGVLAHIAQTFRLAMWLDHQREQRYADEHQRRLAQYETEHKQEMQRSALVWPGVRREEVRNG